MQVILQTWSSRQSWQGLAAYDTPCFPPRHSLLRPIDRKDDICIWHGCRRWIGRRGCMNDKYDDYGMDHKVYIYKEYHSVCPFVGIGTLPTPFSPASVPSPQNRGGSAHSPAGQGLGSPNSDNLRKSLALCLLWAWTKVNNGVDHIV